MKSIRLCAKHIYEMSSLLLTLLLLDLGFLFPLERKIEPEFDSDPVEEFEPKLKIIYGVKYDKVIYPDGDYELF